MADLIPLRSQCSEDPLTATFKIKMKLIIYQERQKTQTLTECLGFLCKAPNNMAPAASQVLPSLPGCHRFLRRLSVSCPGASALAVPSAWSSASPLPRSSSSSLRPLGSYPDLPSEAGTSLLFPVSASRFWPFWHLLQGISKPHR